MTSRRRALVVGTLASFAAAVPAAASAKPFIDNFSKIKVIASTVPATGAAMGDQNPYGVAVVPHSSGRLVKGDVLVSNFNNAQNQQGTGSSIMELSPGGKVSVFAVVPRPTTAPAVGLTTALVVLRSGYVVVGSLPAPGGSSSAARGGALTILNASGHVVKTLSGGDINGPWDMTAVDQGTSAVLFVTNVLNGTVGAGGMVVKHGTVIRIGLRIHNGEIPHVTSNQVIARGFAEHTDPSALVVGPTGVGLGRNDVLYVADSNGNRIAAVPNALTRTTALGGGGNTVAVDVSLMDPLGLAIAPNGDVITANGGDGSIVETTPSGHRSSKTLIPNGAGDLFGLAVAPQGHGLYFVDDAGSGAGSNSLSLLH
ncbi:MAG: hypothetical protein JO206_11385 [Solirubrobacterales bacterium]|nr:hypothetical protein [Solirubrobacterales bacterium]